jgi:dTDP-4-amino-4,6-dideoxygalactose transaminase
MQKAYADAAYRQGDFPHSERAANEVLSLPMFPELTVAQILEASSVLSSAVAKPVAG